MVDKTLPLQRTALIELTFSVIDAIRRSRYMNEKTAIKLPITGGSFASGETNITDVVTHTFTGITQFLLVYSYQEFAYDLTIGTETIHGASCSGAFVYTGPITSMTIRSKTTAPVRVEYAHS
jgi:hypothetical protein